jgi:RNA polymerase sigma-70 factor (ECF subfamily)
VSAKGALAERPDPQCLRLYEQEYDYIFRTLRRFGASPADAEDLAQEMFLVMWRRWRDYDRQRPIRPWLAGIAFRLVYNHRTRIGREVPGGLIDVEDDRVDVEMQISLARTRGLVLRLLANLPEKQRIVMVLHEIDGVSIRDLAQLLAVPLFTAYSRLRAARAGFAAAVRRAHEGGGLDQPSHQALLEAERPLPPAPAAARRRAVSQATALIARLGNESPSPPPQATGGATKLLLGGAGAVALAALTAVVWRPAAPRPSTAPRASDPAAAATPARRPGPLAGLGRGLVGYWRFDDGPESAVARDLSGRGNDCRLRHLDPPTNWVAGVHGGAVHLDGAGWLECPHFAAVERPTSELTIAVRVNRGSDTRLRALVSEQHGGGLLDTFHFGFRGEQLMFQSSVWRLHLAAMVPQARRHWVHVAATVGPHVSRLYVDGEPVVTRGTRRPTADGGNNPLLVGGGQNNSNPDGVSERLTGALDDLVIYDRALAPEEIAALAAGADPLAPPRL